MSIRDVGFCLDVRRLFVRRVSANVCNLIIENVAQPIAVALVVVFAFLNRDDPFHFSTNFIYFTTLYAFWVGMFGSCQSLNTELRNGEWSYWILGLGRNRIVHLLAICFTNLLFAFLQIALFVGTILAFKYLVSFHSGFGLEDVYRNFVNCFVSCTKEKSSLFQMQGLLKLYLEHMMPGWGSEVFAFGIFSFSLVSAVISGVGFGVLFSTLFRDPVVSLNVSVGFVVVIGMLSYEVIAKPSSVEHSGVGLYPFFHDRKSSPPATPLAPAKGYTFGLYPFFSLVKFQPSGTAFAPAKSYTFKQ